MESGRKRMPDFIHSAESFEKSSEQPLGTTRFEQDRRYSGHSSQSEKTQGKAYKNARSTATPFYFYGFIIDSDG